MPLSYHCFRVVKPIRDPQLEALVNNEIVWWPDRILHLRQLHDGRLLRYVYPAHYTFLLLKYEDHLFCHDDENPRLLDLAQRVVGDLGQSPRIGPRGGPARPHLRLLD